MKITIDTKQDSVEEIKQALELLNSLIEKKESEEEFSSSHIKTNISSPAESSSCVESSPISESENIMGNMFETNSKSITNEEEKAIDNLEKETEVNKVNLPEIEKYFN